MELSAVRAVVTGGAEGIGRGIAGVLAREGASVVIADVDEPTGRATASELGVQFVRADVTSDEDLRRLFETAARELGGVNVLVNNAGGVEGPSFPAASVDQWREVLELNLWSVMRATQLAYEQMDEGVVVSIGSVAALHGTHTAPEYAAAKAGVVRLTTALPVHDGVRLVCVCPDSVRTPAMERTLATRPPDYDPGPMLEPSDVAEVVADLIRDDDACGRVVVVRAGERPRVVAD